MTRVTSDVDVLNDLFTSGVVTVFGDVFTLVGIMARDAVDGLAAGAGRLLGAAAHRARSRSGSGGTCASRTASCAAWIARINAFLQENITGMSTVQLFRREALNFARFDEIDRKHRDANIESIFYYAVFYPAIEAVSALASALIIWYGGGSVMQRHADPRRAGRVPPVLAALLPADQRHVGEVQRAAVGDGVVRADLRAARRAGCRSSLRRGRSRVPGRPPVTSRSRTSGSRTTTSSRRTSVLRVLRGGEPGRGLGPQGRELRGQAGRARRHRRRHGLGKDDAHQPAAAVLRREARADHGRWRGHARARSGRAARPLQPRPAGRAPVFRHDRRQHPAGEPVDRRRADAARGRSGPCRRLHRAPAGRLRKRRRRAGCDAVGRPETAALVRARAGIRSAGARSWTRRRRASTPKPSCSSATRCAS